MRIKNFNVLMAAEEFAPDFLGGAGRWLFEVARCLVKRGNRISLVVRRFRPDLPAKETIDGIQVFRYGKTPENSLLNGLSCFFQGKALVKALWKRENFDLCHIHQPFSGFLTYQGSPRNKPMLYNYYSPWHAEYLVDQAKGEDPGLNPGYWTRFAIERYVVNRCRKFIVLSNYSMGQVDQYHHLKERCIKIPGGIDIDHFSPTESKNQAKKMLGFTEYPFLLFTVRSLRHRTGLFELLETITLLQKGIPGIHLIIAGRGPLQHDLENKIVTSNLQSSVSLIGKVPDEKLPLYYKAADLFVVPTQKLEGFGLITVESLACGTPVVATPVGANVELLRALDERLLTPGSGAGDMAETILGFYREPDKRIDSKTCIDFAQQFSWEHIAEQVENCYKDLN